MGNNTHPTDIIYSIGKEILEKPYPPVSDRYFEHRYCCSIGNKITDVHQRVSFHSNRICMISLAESHPVIKESKKVVKINCQISEKIDRLKNSMSGKGKRGAQKLEPDSVICFVECEDKTSYPVYSCVKGKLLEMNDNIFNNASLVVSEPKSKGYIALILPILSIYEETKKSMLSCEDYNK